MTHPNTLQEADATISCARALSPASAEALRSYTAGVAKACIMIANHGTASWSKGVDAFSHGMNDTANFWTNLHQESKASGDSKPLDTDRAIDILNTIRYVTKNVIKQDGMKAINELAAVCIGVLGGNPHDA